MNNKQVYYGLTLNGSVGHGRYSTTYSKSFQHDMQSFKAEAAQAVADVAMKYGFTIKEITAPNTMSSVGNIRDVDLAIKVKLQY